MQRIVLLAVALAACTTTAPTTAPVAAKKAAQVNGPCVIEQQFVTKDKVVGVGLKAYYTVCPPDSVIKAMGWTRVP
jgi:hypothetical protein